MSNKDHAAERRADLIKALEAEKAGYVARNLPDRVKAVDAELKRLTGVVKDRAASPKSEA